MAMSAESAWVTTVNKQPGCGLYCSVEGCHPESFKCFDVSFFFFASRAGIWKEQDKWRVVLIHTKGRSDKSFKSIESLDFVWSRSVTVNCSPRLAAEDFARGRALVSAYSPPSTYTVRVGYYGFNPFHTLISNKDTKFVNLNYGCLDLFALMNADS